MDQGYDERTEIERSRAMDPELQVHARFRMTSYTCQPGWIPATLGHFCAPLAFEVHVDFFLLNYRVAEERRSAAATAGRS
jgi:hypothetical protein